MMNTMIKAGFDNGVEGSQAVFHSLMQAMAEPAGVVELAPCCEHPEAIYPTTAATLLTLCDQDTKVQLAVRGTETAHWLRFHTAAPFVAGACLSVDFVVVAKDAGGECLDTDGLPVGTPEYPERSATLIIEVEAFGAGDAFVAQGPGIDGEKDFSVSGFAEKWQRVVASNRGIFPQGIDLILVSPTAILCLPRTTQLNRVPVRK